MCDIVWLSGLQISKFTRACLWSGPSWGQWPQGEVIVGVQVRYGGTWDQLGDGEDGGRHPGLREAEWSRPGG